MMPKVLRVSLISLPRKIHWRVTMNINSSAGFEDQTLDCKEGIAKENSDWLLVDLVEPNTIPPVSFQTIRILFQVRQLFFRTFNLHQLANKSFWNYTLGCRLWYQQKITLWPDLWDSEFEMGIVFKTGSLLNFNVFLGSCRFTASQ